MEAEPPAELRELLRLAGEADERSSRSQDPRDLEQAVMVWRRTVDALRRTAVADAVRVDVLNQAAGALLRHHQATGRRGDDLDTAVGWLEEVLATTSADAPERPLYLSNLGVVRREQYAASNDLATLERALDALEGAVQIAPADDPDLPMYLSNLGYGLVDRFAVRRHGSDLDRAIAAGARAVRLTPHRSPDRPLYLNNLGNALQERYGEQGTADDLDAAVAAYRQAVRRARRGSADLAMFLANLGEALRLRYLRSNRAADLRQALAACQRAVRLTPSASPLRATAVASLANVLREQYLRDGGLAALDRAVEFFDQVLGSLDEHAPELPGLWNDLANCLRDRYSAIGDRNDLDRAIELSLRAIGRTGAHAADGALYLSNLGAALRARYLLDGHEDDLHQAVEAYRRSVELTADGDPELGRRLNNLGNGLHDRYARTGELADLDAAISVYREALTRVPPDTAELARIRNNLGNGLADRYDIARAADDLDEAIASYQDAVNRVPRGAPELPTYLGNLGSALRERHHLINDASALDSAVAAHRRSLRLTPRHSPDRAYRLSNYGVCLMDRALQTGARRAAARAVRRLQAALDGTSADSPNLYRYIGNLANALRQRHERLGDPDDLRRGIHLYRRACTEGLGTATAVALYAARDWAEWASSRQAWQEAGEACNRALDAMERLFQIQLGRADKELWLREVRRLPGQAAYAHAHACDSARAVVALERGRAMLLSEALQRGRADLQRLADLGHGGLVERYRQVTALLDQPTPIEFQRNSGGVAERQARRVQLQDQLAAVITAIRAVPGYEHFLDVPSITDVRLAAGDRPLAYIAASDPGGVALVVGTHGEVAKIWLPELTDRALRAHVALFQRAYRQRRTQPAAWAGTLDAVTRWLWTAVMGPIADALGSARRAALVPVGLLGVLPLHAAWAVDESRPTGRQYVLDGLAVSYVPNAQALHAARAIAQRTPPATLLAVDEPRPVQAGPLAFAHAEIIAASSYFTRGKVLRHEAATPQAVRRRLACYAVHHFACHGRADLTSPLDSALLLAGGTPLSLGALLSLRLADAPRHGARLAVLSACETNVPGAELPDEVVSLPTGLLQAGLAGVVASQWAVSGFPTAMVMTRFYDLWQGEGLEPGEALRLSQCWLRDTTNEAKATYFKGDGGTRYLPAEAARQLWRGLVSRPPQARDFAHPAMWAAFAHVGA